MSDDALTVSLDKRIRQTRQVLQHSYADTAVAPALGVDLLRLSKVASLDCTQFGDDLAVVDQYAHLVVERKGSDVQVAGTDHCNAIVDARMLGMKEIAVIEMNLHAGIEQAIVVRLLRELDNRLVGFARDNEVNVDPTLGGHA